MLGPALFAVARGQEVGKVGGAVLRAPQAGVLRGLTRDNVLVAAGAKVVEVDPRGRLEVAGGSASGRAASRRAPLCGPELGAVYGSGGGGPLLGPRPRDITCRTRTPAAPGATAQLLAVPALP